MYCLFTDFPRVSLVFPFLQKFSEEYHAWEKRKQRKEDQSPGSTLMEPHQIRAIDIKGETKKGKKITNKRERSEERTSMRERR
jgi:hypothetical protein